MDRFESTRGQTTVEFTATFVILVVLVLGALSVAWAVFERSQMDYALANVGSTWLPAELGEDPDAEVKDMVVNAGLFIDPDDVEVEDASLQLIKDDQVQTSNPRAEASGAADAKRTVRRLRIRARVVYTYTNILTGFSPKTYTRTIDRTVTVGRDYQVF